MEQLEAAGIVGPPEGVKPRIVFVKDALALEVILSGDLKAQQNYREYFNKNYRDRIDSKKNEMLRHKKEEEEMAERENLKRELLEVERKKRIKMEVKEELIKEGLIFNAQKNREKNREQIPQEVMDLVWNRDGGACVKCGSREDLEFDHIIPFSKGGATTYRNLQILCKSCNIKKSNNIG